jgi:hypothetical protein
MLAIVLSLIGFVQVDGDLPNAIKTRINTNYLLYFFAIMRFSILFIAAIALFVALGMTAPLPKDGGGIKGWFAKAGNIFKM